MSSVTQKTEENTMTYIIDINNANGTTTRIESTQPPGPNWFPMFDELTHTIRHTDRTIQASVSYCACNGDCGCPCHT